MNTPVSFEIAKSLKEKGFPQPESVYEASQNGLHFTWYNGNGVYMASYNLSDTTQAPTIAEVVMWLYEKHKIWIEISLMDNSRGYYFDYTIVTSKDRDFNDKDCFDSAKRINDKGKHASPTVAYEAGIEHTLNNII